MRFKRDLQSVSEAKQIIDMTKKIPLNGTPLVGNLLAPLPTKKSILK
jgi:hypothetical protein